MRVLTLAVGVEMRRHRTRILRDMPAALVGSEHLAHPGRQSLDGGRIGARQRDDGASVTSLTALLLHERGVDPDMRGKVCLVDDEQVGA